MALYNRAMTESEVLTALYQGKIEQANVLAEAKGENITLFEAAALGRARDVAVLLQMRRELALDFTPDGFTPLHLAAFFGHHYCVRLLLEERADPNAVSKNALRVTPLHSATANHDEASAEPIVAALLNAGANPNALQAGDFTPLMAARQNGHTRVARLLLAKGAS